MSSVPMLPNQNEWAIIKEQASILVKSGFLPTSVKTPEQAIAIALYGREIGIPMMQSYSQISVINGKPSQSAENMLYQIYKNCPGAVIDIVESTDDKCVIMASRSKTRQATRFEFTFETAKKAGFAGKAGVWQWSPKTMLKWRTVSDMARTLFPDAVRGISHTPEELGAVVDENGEVIEVTPDDGQKKIGATQEPNRESVSEVPKNEGATQEKAKTGIYNREDKKHQDWLVEQLESVNFPKAHYDELAGDLHNKPAKLWKQYVTKYQEVGQ